MNYFEKKKRMGLIMTAHNISEDLPYISMSPDFLYAWPIEVTTGPTYWSHKSHRYRTCEEQKQFIKDGCVDKRLPPLPEPA